MTPVEIDSTAVSLVALFRNGATAEVRDALADLATSDCAAVVAHMATLLGPSEVLTLAGALGGS